MSRIVILDRDVANQIAAGEVIERPAAVVKELVENSIDAGARHVDIEFTGNGLDLIKVKDDGFGMTEEEVLTALHRHATSKIRAAADLTAIMTLGFRGEALPSIAAVGRVEILTAPTGAVAGSLVKVVGGGAPTVERQGAPSGTVVTVRDLFFNTPARKKYLKRPQTEAAHIMEAVIRLALAHPEVSFRLVRDQRTLLTTAGKGLLSEVIPSLFGNDIWDELLPIEASSDLVKITGYIGRPSLNRANRSHQYFIVNQRYVKNPILTGALDNGYHSYMTVKRFPVAFLSLELNPGEVDVNVHPTKLQVRFSREREIRQILHSSVAATLGRTNLVPGLKLDYPRLNRGKGTIEREAKAKQADVVQERPLELFTVKESSVPVEEEKDNQVEVLPPAPEEGGPNPAFPSLEPLGQVYNTYIVARGAVGLFLIDQHAAHERVLFENLQRVRGEEMTKDRQNLLVPLTLELPRSEWEILMQNLELFHDLGFEAAEFGPRGVIVHSVPTIIPRGKEKDILLAVLAEIGAGWGQKSLTELLEAVTIVIACHSAIKAGKVLNREEMGALIAQLARTKQPFTCPHGRPTVIHLPAGELEKRFKRVQ